MGYKRNRAFRLVFEDPELAEAEIHAKSVPSGDFLKIAELMALRDSGDLTREDVANIRQLFGMFAGALVSWNLEDDERDEDGKLTGRDIPVPATLEGLLTQDFDFVMDVISAWMDAVTGVPDDAPGDLGKDFASGVTFPEASLPMDPLSDARLSLTGHV
jgi:hypothetical protein